ncbi:MAG: hypothetical protein EHM41_04215 [Chloroflexi bacterium]|nr:MAG: hypothetical protein EHM41_04215 [Chloroflexota bacterium]
MNAHLPTFSKERLIKRQPSIRPTLQSVLQEVAPLPPMSVLIGACDDGLPVMMDLSNPRAGSILIVADAGAGKANLLNSIINSACTTTSVRQLRVAVLTVRPELFQKTLRFPHTYKSGQQVGIKTDEVIAEMTTLAQDRKTAGISGPAVILAVDDLPGLLASLDPDQAENLLWLVREGPAVQVRVIATTESKQLDSMERDLFERFGAWLIGNIENDRTGMNLAQIPEETYHGLKKGSQFCVYFENEWVPFWVLC